MTKFVLSCSLGLDCASVLPLGALILFTLLIVSIHLSIASSFILPKMSLLYVAVAVAAALGVLSHIVIFIRGEHHQEGPLWLNVFLLTLCLSFIDQTATGDARIQLIVASFIASLFISMLVYRLFFHRLRAFPGPVLARISKFWHVGKVMRRSDNFRQLDQLYREYGDFVRTGIHEVEFVSCCSGTSTDYGLHQDQMK